MKSAPTTVHGNTSNATVALTNVSTFSETESTKLQMVPSMMNEFDDDKNESQSDKKRHFNIFEVNMLPTKKRTECNKYVVCLLMTIGLAG